MKFIIKKLYIVSTLQMLCLCGVTRAFAADGDIIISGDRMVWHKVTLTLDGPAASVMDTDNPFLNRRFNVTFTSPSNKSYIVPGYFAGDGSGGWSGDRWVAHLNPSEIGVWTYKTSFRSGTDLAVDLNANAGTAITPFNDVSGSFTIGASDKSGADFRAADKGMLTNRNAHYLTFGASNKPFILTGPGIPENILGYRGFTNTSAGIGHKFDAHLVDWKAGDPNWPDTGSGYDGKNLIGAINFIANNGANSLYMMSQTIGGDGKDCFPHPLPNYDANNVVRYDLLKLKQWDIALAYAQTKGIFLHWCLSEHEIMGEYGGSGTTGSPTTVRKLYFRMMNAFFGNYNGLQWNLAEEPTWSSEERARQAIYMKAIDPYDHSVTHQFGGLGPGWGAAGNLYGKDYYDTISLQGGSDRGSAFAEMKPFREDSANRGFKLTVMIDEPQKIENNNSDSVGYPYGRRDKMWPCLMGGASGFLWYIQQNGGGHGFDQRIEDFNMMKDSFRWSGFARDFLMPLPLLTMVPSSTITASTNTANNAYTLFKQGDVYAIFNDRAGTGMTLDLTSTTGTYTVKWFDPRNGGALQNGTVTTITGGAKRDLGSAPNNTNMDWAVLVQNVIGVINQTPVVNAGADRAVTLPASASLDGTVSDDSLPIGAAVTTTWTKVSGPGTVSFGNPAAIDTTASFSVAGTYVLRLSASDTLLSASDDVQVVVSPLGTNFAPVVGAGSDQSITLLATASLDGTVSDDGAPSGSTVTTTWTKVSGPGTVSFGNAAAIDTTASFSVVGTYVLRLSASDTLLSASDELQVMVAATPTGPTVTDFTLINADTEAPILNREHLVGNVVLSLAELPPNLALRANPVGSLGSVRFGVNSNDNARTESTAPFAVFGDSSGNYAPWNLTLGRHVITATPFSGSGATGTAGAATTLTLTLLANNTAPIVSAGADKSITLPATASLNGTVSDDGLPTGASVTIAWSVISGPGTVSFSNLTSAATTATFSAPGTYVLQLMAYDDDISTFDQVQVVVASSYHLWAASYGLDNTPGKESGELADPDGDGLLNLLEWTLGGNPLAESRSILPKVSRDATDLNMSFTREDTSEASTTLIAQWSTDMNTWNDVLVGGTSSSPTAAGIKITVTENASAPDTIMFSVPFSNATNGTLFLRLKTTRP